jgi:hypothetical protein
LHFLSVLSSVLHNQQHQELLLDYLLLEVLRDKHLLAHFFQLEQVDLVVMVDLVHPRLPTAPLEGQEVMVEMVDLVRAPIPAALAALVEQEVMVEMEDLVELEVL